MAIRHSKNGSEKVDHLVVKQKKMCIFKIESKNIEIESENEREKEYFCIY